MTLIDYSCQLLSAICQVSAALSGWPNRQHAAVDAFPTSLLLCLPFLSPPFHSQSDCVFSFDALLGEFLFKMGAAFLPTYWLSPITGWSQSPELGGFSAGEGQAAVSGAGLLLSSVALSARLAETCLTP